MKNFLHVDDLNIDQFNEIMDKAAWIKKKFKNNEIYFSKFEFND